MKVNGNLYRRIEKHTNQPLGQRQQWNQRQHKKAQSLGNNQNHFLFVPQSALLSAFGYLQFKSYQKELQLIRITI